MNATTLASRAVLSAYAKKALLPFEIIAMIIFIIALLSSAYLMATVSGWWAILLVVVIAYGLVGSVLWLVIHFTIDKLRPRQTALQEKAVNQFIGRAGKIADTVGLTRFGLIIRIVRDVIARKEDNVLTSFTRDSKGLRTDFENVIEVFRSH